MSGLLNITMGKLLEDVAGVRPHHDAVVYPDRGLRYTYKQFDDLCRRVAKGFMKAGIEKGDHVSIWATNYPEWVTTQFATGKMGAVLVTVNTNYRTAELEYLLRQSDSTTLILMESYRGSSYIEMLYEVVPELRTSEPGKLQSEKLPFLKNVIVLGETRYPGMYLWSDIANMGEEVGDEELNQRTDSLDPDDVINMQYTSGTTGFPKGVMLTHNNIINNALHVAKCLNLTHEDRLCISVPFFHCVGCVMGTLTCVTVGATMVPIQEFDAVKVLSAIQDEKCTALHGVPTMFISELSHSDFGKYDLSSLRTGCMAGSPCPIELMREVIEKMGMREVTIAYGQTEASPVITQTSVNDPIELRVTTVGKVLPHIEAKIVEPGTNNQLPYGVQGELCARGYNVMKGYYKNEEATKAAIDNDGWLHTGDLAIMNENGYFKITGRLKDMIIRGGENIYPREIEEFLYTHPKVLEVQVIGVPDEKFGEQLMAWIRLKEGESITEEEIRDYCIDKISKFKIPRYIQFCDQFPMTASGKIQKFKLREIAIDMLKLQKANSIETA
ncbi:AMP-binding protein [Paenibacillus elgii]|nr:AMP-binding protein [Paenibacillus elgii]